ncbi:hypothetical protein BSFA1_11280 [Burkholderia sp. SFA1]|nr:hypothetical protein BSFA1_11280 [Burkholderia sp. SFA1]
MFVPGTQIVTLVCSMLRVLVAVRVTWIGWTLGVVDCATVVSAFGADAGLAGAGALAARGALAVAAGAAGVAGAEEPPLEPPPPPQAWSRAQSAIERGRAMSRQSPAWRGRRPCSKECFFSSLLSLRYLGLFLF